jgi:hypothetical protein
LPDEPGPTDLGEGGQHEQHETLGHSHGGIVTQAKPTWVKRFAELVNRSRAPDVLGA